jgi:hypothetical protein
MSKRWATVLAVGSLVAWVFSWALLWLSGEGQGWVYEPAVVGLTLGLVALSWFAAIYSWERPNDGDSTKANADRSHRLRSAIAGSVVVMFLILVVDLLTIAGMRESLADLNTSTDAQRGEGASAEQALTFVEGVFDTFRWVVVAVVGFYFAAGAAESIGRNIEQSNRTRADAQIKVAEIEMGVVPTTEGSVISADSTGRNVSTDRGDGPRVDPRQDPNVVDPP